MITNMYIEILSIDSQGFEMSIQCLVPHLDGLLKMLLSRSFLLLVTIVLGSGLYEPPKSQTNHRITVLLSDQKPFVTTGQRQMPKQLHELIIENFAQKFHLKVDYFVVNESLSFTFANVENMKAFPNISLLRYFT